MIFSSNWEHFWPIPSLRATLDSVCVCVCCGTACLVFWAELQIYLVTNWSLSVLSGPPERSDAFPGSGTNLKSTFSVRTESALKTTLNLHVNRIGLSVSLVLLADEIHLTFHPVAVSQEGYDWIHGDRTGSIQEESGTIRMSPWPV